MSPDLRIHARSLFDGRHFADQAWVLDLGGGHIRDIRRGTEAVRPGDLEAAFVMPGLVEAHAHLFLDGSEDDADRRAQHLLRPVEDLVATGKENLQLLLEAGITLVRDAGDRHGVNLACKRFSQDQLAAGQALPKVRACGPAIRKRGRYGSFMAVDVRDEQDAASVVAHLPTDIDDCKILATGVIDFAAGTVKGAPQFTSLELERLIAAAKLRSVPTFAHCSGAEGLARVVAAGIGGIEHGFFMPKDLLEEIARRGITWVGTWSPVAFMRDHGDLAGLDQAAQDGLRHILDHHLHLTALAHAQGVALVAGSDAGSWGVPFGDGLHRELDFLRLAGLPLEAILAAATSVPRRAWGCAGGCIARGEVADLALYAQHPAQGLDVLAKPTAVLVDGRLWQRSNVPC